MRTAWRPSPSPRLEPLASRAHTAIRVPSKVFPRVVTSPSRARRPCQRRDSGFTRAPLATCWLTGALLAQPRRRVSLQVRTMLSGPLGKAATRVQGARRSDYQPRRSRCVVRWGGEGHGVLASPPSAANGMTRCARTVFVTHDGNDTRNPHGGDISARRRAALPLGRPHARPARPLQQSSRVFSLPNHEPCRPHAPLASTHARARAAARAAATAPRRSSASAPSGPEREHEGWASRA